MPGFKGKSGDREMQKDEDENGQIEFIGAGFDRVGIW